MQRKGLKRDGQQRRVTMTDVALALGVSTQTVSNAYSRPDQLSAALRDRVLAMAAQLGYAGPDPIARSLRRGSAGAVGVAFTERLSYAFADPAAVVFLRGLAESVERAGLRLSLLPGQPQDSAGRPDDAVIGNAAIDGLVVYSMPDDDPLVAAAFRRRLPVVVVDQPVMDGTPYIGIDDHGAAAGAAGHLIALGHRDVAVLSFRCQPDGYRGRASLERQQTATYAVTRSRLDGCASVLATDGRSRADLIVYECPGNDIRDAVAAAGVVLERHPRPTAILALSDQLALGALHAAHQRGIAVPEDLSVIGFDDIPLAETASTPLTTVHQPLREKGERGGELLLGAMAGDAVAHVELLPTHVVTRATTAPPPAR